MQVYIDALGATHWGDMPRLSSFSGSMNEYWEPTMYRFGAERHARN